VEIIVPECGGPGASILIAAAERYAFRAAALSLPLILLSAVILLFLRNNVRACCICLMPLSIHPVWLMNAGPYDCGKQLRLASAVWIGIGVTSVVIACLSIYRNGIDTTRLRLPQFTTESLFLVIGLVACVLVLIRPPLVDILPTLNILSGLAFVALAVVGIRSPNGKERRRLPSRMEIPSDLRNNDD
jgi:hypothetical protein